MVAAAPARAISFMVRGFPVTQGSKIPLHRWGPLVKGKPTCKFGMREAFSARLAEWRALISTAAKRALRQDEPFSGPVHVRLTFYFPRPKDHTAKDREHPYVITHERYDVDKLSRACLDALTMSACFGDDSQVAVLEAMKVYATGDERPGVVITVEAL